jgi:hypothetical protein
MAIGKIKASRVNNVDADTYVGEDGILFYNYANGVVRISDGITPGGVSVPYTIASNTTIGGIKAGPGVVISNDGELFIDTTGLPLSFGDFTANQNILTLVNEDENMVLASKGSAEVQLVGNIGFYKTNGLPPNIASRYFQASDDGQVQFLVPNTDAFLGAVEIIGSTTGLSIAPGTLGTMLHVTGQVGDPCRIYYDGNANYVSWVARRWNGTVANPTQVLAGQDVLRINATAATDLDGGNIGNVAMAQISMMAVENQTATAQGSEITFTVTPVGQPATNRVDVANITVANGVSATKFTSAGTITAIGNITGGNVLTSGSITATGNVTSGNMSATQFTGNVTGNLTGTASTATNLAAATSILAGAININPVSVDGSTSSVQTFTLTGLTTNHKIIVTNGTAFNSGLIIQGAWASAVNTISIEFRNTTNQAIDTGAHIIQYFAWV